jgi:hypothetical protein
MARWVRLKMAMATYCEPFFQALKRWTRYQDVKLIENRLKCLLSLCVVLKDWVQAPEFYVFDIVSENEFRMHDRIIPICGDLEFAEGHDLAAFRAADKLIGGEFHTLFQLGGMFFEKTILKAIAGFNDAFLATASTEMRENIINIVAMVFRVTESSGKCKLLYRCFFQ